MVLVHGFTQTHRSWYEVARDLAADHEVVAVDAPGHGASRTLDVAFPAGAGLVGAAGGRGAYVGYSMGGRYCLRLALDEPERVRALVLLSTQPGIDDPAERARRRTADLARAAALAGDGDPHRDAERLAAFLDEWLAAPLFSGLSDEAAGRADRLAHNTAAGLATSLRSAGTATMPPMWDELPSLAMPVLVAAGGDDARYRSLAARTVEAIGPTAELALVAGAGHAAHLEQPAAFIEIVRSFLAAHGC